MVPMQLLVKPLSPWNHCWMEILPDMESFQASKCRIRMVLLACCIGVLTTQSVSNVFQALYMPHFEHPGCSYAVRVCVVCTLVTALLWLYAHSTCLARGRRIAYAFNIIFFCIVPNINAFLDPTDATFVKHVICRRLCAFCACLAICAYVFKHVEIGMMLWSLLGLLLYLMRLYFFSTDEHVSEDSAFSSPLHGIIVTVISTSCFFPSLVLLQVTRHRQDGGKVPGGGNQVLPIAPVANRIIGHVSNLNCDSVVPRGNSVEPTQLACDVQQADALPGVVEPTIEIVLEADRQIFIEREQLIEKEHVDECRYEHYYEHNNHAYSSTNDAEEIHVQETESEQLGDTVVPGAQGNTPDAHSSDMLCLSFFLVSGELISELRIRNCDLTTVLDLKCVIGHKIQVDPLMMELLQQHSQDVLRNNSIVVRLPRGSRNDQLLFTVVVTKTSAYVRDQLLLQSDCISDNATWPSYRMPSDFDDFDCVIKTRPEDLSGNDDDQ